MDPPVNVVLFFLILFRKNWTVVPITYKSINAMLKGVNLIVFVADLAVHDDFVQISLQMGRFFLYFIPS